MKSSTKWTNEWIRAKRGSMLCVQDSEIASEQTLLVAERNIWRKAISPSEAVSLEKEYCIIVVIMWETKFLRIDAINSDKHSFLRKVYGSNLGLNVGGLAHMRFLVVTTCAHYLQRVSYARLWALCGLWQDNNHRRYVSAHKDKKSSLRWNK